MGFGVRLASASLAILLLIGSSGCGEDSDETPSRPTPEPVDRDDPDDESSAEPEHAPPDPAPGRLVRLTGLVTVAGAEAQAGMELDAEAPIVVGEGGRAVISLRDGGRLELDEGAVARLVEDSAAQILLVRGGVYGSQPPAGNAPRPPLRVTSSAATVEVGQSGELYVYSFAWGGSWVAVLQGNAAISIGESDHQRRLRSMDLGPGRAVAIPDRIAEPTDGPGRLSGARAAANALAAAAPESERDDEAGLGTEEDRLDQALRWLETETRRGRELTNAHREAVREGQTEDAQRLQRELVGHSQSLYRLRHLATARWERMRAQYLRLELAGQAPSHDPVSERRDRVAGLLGH